MPRLQTPLMLAALVGCLTLAGSPNANAVVTAEAILELPPIPGYSAVLPDPFRITFDEFGNAFYVQNGLPTVHPLAGTIVDDPTTVGVGGSSQEGAVLCFAGTGGRRHRQNL